MSQSVVVIAPKRVRLSDVLVAVASAGGGRPAFVDHDEQRAQFGGDTWCLTVARISSEYNGLGDYDEWENVSDQLKERLDEVAYWSVRYNSMPHARAFLTSLLEGVESPDDWWIDNDYGVVLRGSTFLGLLLDDVRFDWRKKVLCARASGA